MFYEHLGGNAGESVHNQAGDTAEEIANLGLFTNVQSYDYWSGTVYAPNPSSAWDFNTNIGLQFDVRQDFELYAVAVRPGDVAAVVPEVQTYAMLLAGLAALKRGRSEKGDATLFMGIRGKATPFRGVTMTNVTAEERRRYPLGACLQ